MAVIDMFNYGLGSQGLATQQDYNPNQFNAVGQPLSPTPPANGAPITVDADNDSRQALDYKQQALQAQKDTAGAYDTTNKIVGSTGYHYDKIDDTRAGQARSAAMAFADGYFSHMGDQSQATAAGALSASHAVANIDGMVKRQSMIQDLESKGYNPLDIDKWIQTGNTQDLITNKGSWTSDGKGYLHNTLTGEIKQVPGYQEQEKLTHVDTGDTISFVNSAGQVVNTIPKGVKPTGSAASGGDIGLDEDEANANPAFKVDSNGGLLKLDGYDKNHNPKYVAANSKDIAAYNERQSAGQPTAVQTQQNKNIDKLLSASDDQLEGFVGKADQFADIGGNYVAAQTGEGEREYLAAAKEINGYMQNQGVGAAKAMGLSGINTLEEAKRAFGSMPQLDRSSAKAFRDSVQRIKEYVDNYNAENTRKQGGVAPTTTPAATSAELSDDELLKKYGG